jgi:hypothetical protein
LDADDSVALDARDFVALYAPDSVALYARGPEAEMRIRRRGRGLGWRFGRWRDRRGLHGRHIGAHAIADRRTGR